MTASIKLQRNLAFLAIVLFIIKIIAWYWTKSVAVFTDAMESTVNVATGLIGWYSIWLAQKPRDKNHPRARQSGIHIRSSRGHNDLYCGIDHYLRSCK